MELEGKVVVITRGTNEVGLPLAARFLEQGALVVLADKNERKLAEKASAIGAIGIKADATQQLDIKSLVNKATRMLGRIDLFVSNISFREKVHWFTSESERNQYWHTEVMAQMYAAKHVLPQMINRGNGYLLNMVPDRGLQDEFRSDIYSTLNHPALGFAERMAAIYRPSGIKVSLLCLDTLKAMVGDSNDAGHSRNLADVVVDGIQKEQFMISANTKRPSFRNYTVLKPTR
jgi:NAD(P)-dependent dehydrogenase (short-subunit alcohol dehydrogenase family)